MTREVAAPFRPGHLHEERKKTILIASFPGNQLTRTTTRIDGDDVDTDKWEFMRVRPWSVEEQLNWLNSLITAFIAE